MPKRGRPSTKKKNEDFDVDKHLSDIAKLDSSIKDVISEMDDISALTPPNDLLPGLEFEYTKYNYDKDLETIKEDARDTLDSLSGLYLNKDLVKKKGVKTIIKNDAEIISDIKFSISCAKRGLINCMRQLDAGMSSDPDMHQAVNAYQKEIRDSSKMMNDLLTKMKSFYKDLRDEYEHREINEQQTKNEIGGESGKDIPDDGLITFDPDKWNEIIDDFKKDPTLLKGAIFGTQGKEK